MSYPPPRPLPAWVETITQIIDWLSSFTPSGQPSTNFSNAIYAVLGVVIGGVLVSVPNLRRYLARRAERIAADEAARKLAAKKLNEHIKLFGSFANTVGAAIVGAAFILPYIKDHSDLPPDAPRWVVIGLVLPLVGHVALRFLKSES